MGTPGMKQYWVYEDLVARIKEASGGRLVFQLLPVGAVVGTMESFDAVAKGVVEVGSS
jgi:TRAP-type mannitol/chloroaromatic compound transport system substrate-binding protein